MVNKGKRYRALREIRWGDGHVFRLARGDEFSETDLLPGMRPALAKWLRVGAAAEIEDELEQEADE